jgi:hypothetical protein
MKEYQAVILRLTRHSRGGWELAMLTQAGLRLTVVFQRSTDSER